MTTHIALFRKQPDSDYGVDLPDFPGWITAGKTLEDARPMAAEAIDRISDSRSRFLAEAAREKLQQVSAVSPSVKGFV